MNTDTTFHLGDDGPESFWRDIILTRDECTSLKVQRLHDYWQQVRGVRSMPARRDIDAVDIWLLLPNIHVSEWHENPDRVRYRLAGTEIVASIGREISGHWLTDFHTDPHDVAETMTLYRQVIARRAPVIGRTLGSMRRLGVASFEWILCPLSEDDDVITHFIGLEDYVSNKRYLGAGS
ncbi:PAS domain-containing protein [Dongia sp. agr-C8]